MLSLPTFYLLIAEHEKQAQLFGCGLEDEDLVLELRHLILLFAGGTVPPRSLAAIQMTEYCQ
jgi:hypothetical protein